MEQQRQRILIRKETAELWLQRLSARPGLAAALVVISIYSHLALFSSAALHC